MAEQNELYTQFDNVFFEKTRLSMMTILYQEGIVSFKRFKKIIGGSDGAIYSHLQKLEKGEYIQYKKEINGDTVQTNYSLTKNGKNKFREYLIFLETVLQNQKSI